MYIEQGAKLTTFAAVLPRVYLIISGLTPLAPIIRMSASSFSTKLRIASAIE